MVEKCMDFACELMHLCRGTQEVEAVLGIEEGGFRDPLARLRMAIEYEEKKVYSCLGADSGRNAFWIHHRSDLLTILVKDQSEPPVILNNCPPMKPQINPPASETYP